mgnify:CR=1 FL=1
MRRVLPLLFALFVTGCQLPSAPSAPSGLRPIEGSVTLGNVPVVASAATLTESVTGYDRGESGMVRIESRLRVNACRRGDHMAVGIEFTAVDSTFYNIQESWANWNRMLFAARVGQAWDYDVDLADGSAMVEWAGPGQVRRGAADGEAVFDVMTKQSHFGGVTLRQDEEILHYRLGDLVPGLAGEQAELSYTLRVAGRAVFEQRPVVVVRVSGAMQLDDKPLHVAGIIYLDEATGASLFTDTRLAEMTGDLSKPDVRVVHRLDVAGWPAAGTGAGQPVPFCGGGPGIETRLRGKPIDVASLLG